MLDRLWLSLRQKPWTHRRHPPILPRRQLKAPAIPEGNGVTVESRDGKPVVKVYFASGKTIMPNAFDGARGLEELS